MDTRQIEMIRERLKEELTAKRYEHTEGVAYTAAALAMCHGEDYEKALIAGLLHDCAKGYSTEQLEKNIFRNGINLSEEDRLCPQIYHAIYGPILAKERYGIEDEEILSAIRRHTTGCRDMSRLDMIVFIADAIEPGRGKKEYLEKARKSAFADLNRAMEDALSATMEYLKKKNTHIHEKTSECMEWIKNRAERNTDGQ